MANDGNGGKIRQHPPDEASRPVTAEVDPRIAALTQSNAKLVENASRTQSQLDSIRAQLARVTSERDDLAKQLAAASDVRAHPAPDQPTGWRPWRRHRIGLAKR